MKWLQFWPLCGKELRTKVRKNAVLLNLIPPCAWPWNSWRYDRTLFLERKDYYSKLKEIFLPHRTINLSNIHATYSPKGPFNICEFTPAIFCPARNKEWFERVTWHMTKLTASPQVTQAYRWESVTQVVWVSSSLPFSLPSFPFPPETRDTQAMAQHAKTNDKPGNPVTSS